MEYLSDFDNQIDWNIYEKEEKALPSSITDNKYLLKGYIVKEKGKVITMPYNIERGVEIKVDSETGKTITITDTTFKIFNKNKKQT